MLLNSNNFDIIVKKCIFTKKSHSFAAKKLLFEIKKKFFDLSNSSLVS